jgi:hypothetical protein
MFHQPVAPGSRTDSKAAPAELPAILCPLGNAELSEMIGLRVVRQILRSMFGTARIQVFTALHGLIGVLTHLPSFVGTEPVP